MNNISIADYYISYPDIEINEGISEFNSKIYNLHEFNELELTDNYNIRGHNIDDDYKIDFFNINGLPLKYQELIRRYMSYITGYNRLLLVHEMGLGKTCTAIMMAEKIYSINTNTGIIIHVVSKAGLHYDWWRSILKICTDGLNIVLNGDTEKEYNKLVKKQIRLELSSNDEIRLNELIDMNKLSIEKNGKSAELSTRKLKNKYKLYTYNNFSKNIKNINDNDIVIIDEIQNIIPASTLYKKEKKSKIISIKEQYNKIKNLFDKKPLLKIILLSGTPMINNCNEIAEVLNLIIKDKFNSSDKKVSIRKKFSNTYLKYENIPNNISELLINNSDNKSGSNDKIWEFNNAESISSFKNIIKGKVSVLNYKVNNITKKFIENKDNIIVLRSIKLYGVDMSDEVYNKYNNDTELKKSYQARQKFMLTTLAYKEDYGSISNKNVSIKSRSILSSYSLDTFPKYREILNIVKANSNKKIFIYLSSINNGGINFLYHILKTNKVSVLKYTGEQTLAERNKNKNLFNSHTNYLGDEYQVFIGSAVAQEGITLKDTQICIIAEPEENYSRLSQVMARVVRVSAHDNLQKKLKENKTNVDFYLLCLVDKNRNTADYIKYLRCQNKDISIQNMLRVLIESSFDCSINKKINQGNIPNSRECQYKQECNIKCDIIEKPTYVKKYNNYNMIYFKDYNNKSIQYEILKLFNFKYNLDIKYIKQYLLSIFDNLKKKYLPNK